MRNKVRTIIADNARLSVPIESVRDDDNLHALGLSSLSTVTLMLAIEDAFDIEIPDAMLTRQTFASIAAIAAAVERVQAGHG